MKAALLTILILGCNSTVCGQVIGQSTSTVSKEKANPRSTWTEMQWIGWKKRVEQSINDHFNQKAPKFIGKTDTHLFVWVKYTVKKDGTVDASLARTSNNELCDQLALESARSLAENRRLLTFPTDAKESEITMTSCLQYPLPALPTKWAM